MLWFAKNKWAVAFLGTSLLVVNPAWADKPEWAGNKHEQKEGRGHDRRDDAGREGPRHQYERRGVYFSDHHRKVAADHYARYYQNRKTCPPGLAKKNNGCMPPGQARAWEMHKPLPAGLTYYHLPPRFVTEMGPPPYGYDYVRVGADILLIAVGTHMVVDAITDIVH